MEPTVGPAEPALGHVRPRGWGSVRIRVLLPGLICVGGMVVLGLVQVNGALTVANRASQTGALAHASGTIGALVHQVAADYVLTNASGRARENSQLQTKLARQLEA